MGKTKEWHLNKSEAEISKWINTRGKQISSMGRLILASENISKLSNALQTYAKLEKNEDPFILYDDTLLGSGKDGFLITNKNVYTHKPFAEAHKIAIDDIKVVCGNTEIYFYKLDICTGLSFIDSPYKTELIQFLNSILAKNNKQSENEDDEDEDIDEEEDEDENINNDEIDDIDDDDDGESEFEESDDDESEDEEDVDDDDEYEEDNEEIEVSSKSSKVKRTTRNKTFEGILYDDYKIGRGMLFDEAVKILKENNWKTVGSNNTIDAWAPEGATLYGFPITHLQLAKRNIDEDLANYNEGLYGELLSSVRCFIPGEYRDDFSSFLYEHVYKKYDFFNKTNHDIGLEIYAPVKNNQDKPFFERLEKELDYTRAIVTDYNSTEDEMIIYSFLSNFYLTGEPDFLYQCLKNEWAYILIIDTEDDANIIFGKHNGDFEKESFFKLLKKWDDILSRKEAEIEISFPPDKKAVFELEDQIKISYQGILNFYFYKQDDKKVKLELNYKKDSYEIEGCVEMNFEQIYNNKYTTYEKKIKLCLHSLLSHLELYIDDDFSGEEMWENLSSKHFNISDAYIKEMYYRILSKKASEESKKKRQKDEDDFDNL